MTGKASTMGAPLPTADPVPPFITSEFGDFEDHDGGRLSILGNQLVIELRLGEGEAEVGIEIAELLSAIERYTKAHES